MDYSDILVQPYSPTTLCNTITTAIQYNHTQLAEINRKQQIDRDESERILKFRARMGKKLAYWKTKVEGRGEGPQEATNFAVDPVNTRQIGPRGRQDP